jgi:hypothetical protein
LYFFTVIIIAAVVAASHTMVALSDVVLNFTTILTTSSGVPTSRMPLQSTYDVNATDMPSTPTVSADESEIMQYLIIPLGIFILLCLLAVMVIRFLLIVSLLNDTISVSEISI